MAPPSFSPTTSISSHTLSAQSAQPPAMDLQASSTHPLISSLSSAPQAFLQPPRNLHTAALTLAKQFLDPLASGVSEAQTRRQKENGRKRKRGEWDDGYQKVLQLKKVHLDGFGINQVWEQARRVLDAACVEVEQALAQAQKINLQSISDIPPGVVEDGAGLSDENELGTSDSESLGEEVIDWEYDGDDLTGSLDAAGGQVDLNDLSGEDAFSGVEDIDVEDEDFNGRHEMLEARESGTFFADPNGLNDGFFEIDDFNKQSEFLEQQDARGEPPASDDEDIDWDANPMVSGPGDSALEGRPNESDENDDGEEAGPTFSDADLDAPEGDSEEEEPFEEDRTDDLGDTSKIMYADFFAPPTLKGNKKMKRGRPNPHNFPSASDPQISTERTMSTVHRDLFEDSDNGESDGDLTDLDPSDPMSRRSAHERRQAKLAEEIRRLEAASVARREWTLSGEVRAADRPLNSLLEEDLDFERAGKPVPVITAEVSEDIEALIKRRILAGEFDECRRRRPDDLVTGPKFRRGQFDLDDTKSGKGLAEIYEEEHLRNTDPNFVDVNDEKLRKEHREIEALWTMLSRKLDGLSSWHYKPKPAASNLEVRVDAPAIEMEDARPTTGGEVAGASMLAPQEVYKSGEQRNKEEIVTKSGMPVAREEMTREQKLRRRRREKERIKKAGLNEPANVNGEGRKVKEKKHMLGDLKKGGVRIIGRKGEVTDVEGKQVKDKSRFSAGSFKL